MGTHILSFRKITLSVALLQKRTTAYIIGAALLTAGIGAAISIAETTTVNSTVESPIALPSKDDESEPDAPIDATITWCHDGDTCRIVTTPGKLWMNVRLGGIDAPEVKKVRGKNKSGQDGGDQARDYLQSTIQGKKVSLKQTDLDHYNRPVVEIFLEGKNINIDLVSKGFAEAYRGKTKRLDSQAYLKAEATAKEAQLGVWGLKNYQSPGDFRKKNRVNSGK